MTPYTFSSIPMAYRSDWFAPNYTGTYTIKKSVTGTGDLWFTNKTDRVYITADNWKRGNGLDTYVHLKDGYNHITAHRDVYNLRAIGGRDGDIFDNVKVVHGYGGSDVALIRDLGNGTESAFLSMGAGRDLTYSTANYGRITHFGGKGADDNFGSNGCSDTFRFLKDDSRTESGAWVTDRVFRFRPGEDKIDLFYTDIGNIKNIHQWAIHNENGQGVHVFIPNAGLNISVYTTDGSTSLDSSDFLF